MDSENQSPSIAFVGLLGSGKTTLAATMANRLVTPDERGVFLVPVDHKTMVAVQQTWLHLQSREWPAPTLQGTFSELRWKLHVGPRRACEMRMVDVAGQDLYDIFSEDRALSPDKIPDPQKAVLEYCRGANIVLLLVNLGDFVGEGDRSIAMRNEAAMKAALDYLRSCTRYKRMALVLTQADLYFQNYKASEGWAGMLATYMPFLFNSHLRDGNIPVLPVAAVFDTEILFDPQSGPRRVPTPNFRSVGIDVLIQWLADQVLSLQAPTEPEPKIVETKTEWVVGLMKTHLVGYLDLKNDGGGGQVRVIATSLCNGLPVESVVQEISLTPHQEVDMTFPMKATRFIQGKQFTIQYRFEKR